jgi:hypothetical protein
VNDASFDRRPLRKPAVDVHIMDDFSSCVVDAEARQAHAFNPVATAVIERCDGKLAASAIIAELSDIFDCPPDRIARDVEVFLTDLAMRGLIDW